MTNQCPQDGGFIGESGCTHRNHKHSEHVNNLLAMARKPEKISVEACDKALDEGFYVSTRWNTRVGFGKRFKRHTEDHPPDVVKERKEHLLFAIKTVRAGKRGPNPKGGKDSYAYAHDFGAFGMLVTVDAEGMVEEAFSFHFT